MAPVSHGKSYAENSHIRAEEGTSTSVKPTRAVILHKKKDDPIISYLKDLGCRQINSVSQFYNYLEQRLGDGAHEVCEVIQARGAHLPFALSDQEFYDWKNADYGRSLSINFLYDCCFLRDVGRILPKFVPRLGKNVLDLGCENGVLTCFLARIAPDSNFLGVDRCERAIANAKRLTETLGISNVRFAVGDTGSLKGKTYDTVITSRTAHENFKNGPYPYHLKISEQIKFFQELHSDFARKVCGLVAEHGNLLAISRATLSPAYCGRMFSIVGCGFKWQYALWTEVSHHHPVAANGRYDYFQVALLEQSQSTLRELVDEFYLALDKTHEFNDEVHVYEGEQALWMRMRRAGRLMYSRRLVATKNDYMCGEYLIFEDREDVNSIWVYLNNNNSLFTFEHLPKSEFDNVRGRVDEWADASLRTGGLKGVDVPPDTAEEELP